MQVASFYVARASPPTAQAKWSAAYTEPPAYLPPRQYQWRRGGGACVRTRVRFPLPARACDVVVTPPRGPGAPCTGAPMLAWGSSRRTSISLSLARYVLNRECRARAREPIPVAPPHAVDGALRHRCVAQPRGAHVGTGLLSTMLQPWLTSRLTLGLGRLQDAGSGLEQNLQSFSPDLPSVAVARAQPR